ncbi:ATP-grasp domain-containing protein [Fulvivirga kasyanovii]
MRIIFCNSIIDNKQVEPDYEDEMKSAIKAGFRISLVNFEELTAGNTTTALKLVHKAEKNEQAIYRGWMLTPDQYKNLYEGLAAKHIQLINTPEEYIHCHYLPESYHKIEGKTPKSVWTTEQELSTLIKLVSEFGEAPIVIKDYVKSEKHNWNEACYIPDASDSEKIKSTVEKFLNLRGDSLNKGLVFRQFEELGFLTNHSKSGMPLTKEFRVFFLQKQCVTMFNYWDEGAYDNTKPKIDEFIEVARDIESNFFTMDIAQKKNGDWVIMELGDGQVAGLPDNADKDEFYKKLNALLS